MIFKSINIATAEMATHVQTTLSSSSYEKECSAKTDGANNNANQGWNAIS
jgi:hypothetical protein